MAALDTNVLVRWLTDDDTQQSAIVARLLESSARKNERLFVTVTVMLETEWVLRSRYSFDKPSVTAAMDALLSQQFFQIPKAGFSIVGKNQICAFLVKFLGNPPSDAPLVGHTHH